MAPLGQTRPASEHQPRSLSANGRPASFLRHGQLGKSSFELIPRRHAAYEKAEEVVLNQSLLQD